MSETSCWFRSCQPNVSCKQSSNAFDGILAGKSIDYFPIYRASLEEIKELQILSRMKKMSDGEKREVS